MRRSTPRTDLGTDTVYKGPKPSSGKSKAAEADFGRMTYSETAQRPASPRNSYRY